MNRAARRVAEQAVRRMKRKAAADPEAIELRGGPMDRWVVKPGADALRPDWWTTWPPTVAARHRPGRYEVATSGGRRLAFWREGRP